MLHVVNDILLLYEGVFSVNRLVNRFPLSIPFHTHFLQKDTVQRVLNSSVMTRPIAAFTAHRLSQTSRESSHRWPAPRNFTAKDSALVRPSTWPATRHSAPVWPPTQPATRHSATGPPHQHLIWPVCLSVCRHFHRRPDEERKTKAIKGSCCSLSFVQSSINSTKIRASERGSSFVHIVSMANKTITNLSRKLCPTELCIHKTSKWLDCTCLHKHKSHLNVI